MPPDPRQRADGSPAWNRLERDPRVVLTLDAGGTTFVFSAMQGGREVVAPFTLPPSGSDLPASLHTLEDGFARVCAVLGMPPVAISFGFPGPADYPAGIVGNTLNLPAFTGGVAVGPMLEDRFGLPVFINNDGGLFTLGEAIAGFLPHINRLLAERGSRRRFQSLFGATLGTGFGGGIVYDGKLHLGDNGAAGEVSVVRHKLEGARCAEDGVSARAVRQEYARRAGIASEQSPEPHLIFEIAEGRHPGEPTAAREAFRLLGEVAGDALANAVALLDAPVVIGGGLTGAACLFLPALVKEMNAPLLCGGAEVARTAARACNVEDEEERESFLKSGADDDRRVPGSGRLVRYASCKAIPVGLSRLGASRATAVGAYAVALDALDARAGAAPTSAVQ